MATRWETGGGGGDAEGAARGGGGAMSECVTSRISDREMRQVITTISGVRAGRCKLDNEFRCVKRV